MKHLTASRRTMKRARLLFLVLATLLATLVVSPADADASAFSCDGKTVTVDLNLGQSPTSGDDVIRGTTGTDRIYAGDGDDTVCAGGGRDFVYGEAGNDRIFGNTGRDVLNGGPGNDVLSGQNGNDTIRAGGGHDKVWGGAGHDTINGGSGNDNLNGNAGDDVIFGDGGTDKGRGGPGNDLCLTETTPTCESDGAPDWVGDSGIVLERSGLFDFTISWEGMVNYPTTLELTVTNSIGQSDFYEIDFRTEPDFTVNTFDGYAFVPGETFHLSMVPTNALGAGPERTLIVGAPEFVTRSNGGSSAAANAAQTPLPAGCTSYLSDRKFGIVVNDVYFWIGDHAAKTIACHDGTNVTVNNVVPVLCDERDDWDVLATSTPLETFAGGDGGPIATNRFGCKMSVAIEVTAEVSAGIPLFAEASLGVGTVIDWDVDHLIIHDIRPSPGGDVVIDATHVAFR